MLFDDCLIAFVCLCSMCICCLLLVFTDVFVFTFGVASITSRFFDVRVIMLFLCSFRHFARNLFYEILILTYVVMSNRLNEKLIAEKECKKIMT